MLVFLYRVYYTFAVPACLTIYYNLQIYYGLYTDNFPSFYTSKNPIVINSVSLLTFYTINTSYSGLVNKAKE